MTEITAAMVKQLRDATSAGMMDCKRALAGDGRRLRRGRQAPAREGHGVGREARRPRDERGQGRRDGARQRRRDRRDRLRDRARVEQRRVPRVRGEGARDRVRRRRCRPTLEDERVELAAKLGENIQVVGTKRMEAGDGEVLSSYVHAPANKVGALVRTKGGDAASGAQPRAAPDVRPADVRRARRGAAGARRRRARDPLELRRGALEARERPREDRRGPAEQEVLRRGSAHRADVVPRRRVDRRRSASTCRSAGSSSSTTPGTRFPRTSVAFNRVLLKLSGEALMGSQEYGLDAPTVDKLARELVDVRSGGLEVAIVIGGGNIYRGMSAAAAGHRPRDRRLHGDARDRAERARRAGGARAQRRRHARALGDRGAGGGGAVHPPPRGAPPREGPRRDLRRRHGQPVLHDRHGGGAARARDRRRGDPDGEARGRRASSTATRGSTRTPS